MTFRLVIFFCAVLSASLCFSSPFNPKDIPKVEGPKACMECHTTSGKVWEGMRHFKTFRDMPRKQEARIIANKMGIKRIKQAPLCLKCHFTVQNNESGRARPISGISCESCHGAGRDWINVHSDYGGKNVSREKETPEHRAMRIKKSEEAGMIRPDNIFAWAKNCFECHTVPHQGLVNRGGHPAGSKFELVAWSQGEVRHNVWFSENAENRPETQERKRVIYVTGRAMDLAFALKGLASATNRKTYAVTMAKRAKVASLWLEKIQEAEKIPEVTAMLQVFKNQKLIPNNRVRLTRASNKLFDLTKQFTEKYDGSQLRKIDPLLPKESDYVGTPAPAK